MSAINLKLKHTHIKYCERAEETHTHTTSTWAFTGASHHQTLSAHSSILAKENTAKLCISIKTITWLNIKAFIVSSSSEFHLTLIKKSQQWLHYTIYWNLIRYRQTSIILVLLIYYYSIFFIFLISFNFFIFFILALVLVFLLCTFFCHFSISI